MYYNQDMPYDKSKSQQVSVRIPHDLWRDIESYYSAQGEKRLSKNDKVVLILDKWMADKIKQSDQSQRPGRGTKRKRAS